MDTLEMDEPFLKRPRLSMFPSDDHLDEELGCRRARNDLLLKSRFESIFEKYARDFSGIGDEIEIDTLTVVVNNGHLQSMANETDPGGLRNMKGESLLRAMTEALGDDEGEHYNAGADVVMTSIEEIAQNAAMAEDQEETAPMDSDEELFLPLHARASQITPSDSRESHITAQSDPIESEPDSLFEAHQLERSDSPDSLFEIRPFRSSDSDTSDPRLDSASQDGEVDDSAILQKFGPRVGREVLTIIKRAKNAAYQAHIEPAWRIPSSIVPPEQRQATSKSKTPSNPILISPETQQILSPEHAESLWKPTRFRSTKRATHQIRVMRRIRAESEDPLQEDFADSDWKASPDHDYRDESDWEAGRRPKQKMKTKVQKQAQRQTDIEHLSDCEEEEPPKRKRRADADEQILQMRRGTCFYCKQRWNTRGGVFKHWVKLVNQFDKGEVNDDDTHDLDYVHAYVANSNRAQKGPRLVISDFKTLVELHEGAGISFNEIAELRALRTKKNGLALNVAYDRYRILSDHFEDGKRGWSKEELQTLQELCQTPRRDVGTFASYFEDRSNTDIGGKLAEIWLGELIDSGQIFAKAVRQKTPRFTRPDHAISQDQEYEPEPQVDELFIKQEPGSDDELFGRS